ncbi:MAG: hypothetical protein RL038_45 [Actinomycetota bacterium]|jgi:pimeloyl-ACP methyl ester carboxylesterase
MKFKLLMVAALALAACSTTDASNVTKVRNPSDVFAEYNSQVVQWDECDSSLFDLEYADSNFDDSDIVCAEISVPFHYEVGNVGDDLTLTIMKDPASGTTSQYQGALFMNPGGPGQSGITHLQSAALPSELRDAYDIIGVDPRGVGSSSPVRCSDELDLRSYFEYPFDVANAAEAAELEKASTEFYADCIEKNPHWWAIGTENVVRDFELLRQILTPEAKFNFIGHSYGTTLAGRYISEFPEHVGRIVLDSPVKPDDGEVETQIQQSESLAAARTRIFEKCAADDSCPGSTVKEVENNLISIRDAVLADETSGYVFEQMGGSKFFKSGTGESAYLILRGIDLLTYYPLDEIYDTFKQVYKDGLDGWVGGFEWLGLSMDGYDSETLERDNSYEVLTIVNCLDIDGRDTRTESEIDAETELFEAADPFGTRFYELYDYEAPVEEEPGCFWSWETFDSDEIPDAPATQDDFSNDSGAAVVTIGSKGDNVTPYVWSQNTSESLKSDLITYEGTGHAVLWGTSSCIDKPVLEYLLTGRAPGSFACKAV